LGKDAEPSADNRRDIAVAISQDRDNATRPPKIVATGYGVLARKILEIAFENDIKVREDPDLVSILAAIDEGGAIPANAIIVVAEILAYLYRVNGARESAHGDG
jgi:flagellar biosynthesis protein